MDQLPGALEAFKCFNQFILWKTADRAGKLVKLPADRNGLVIDSQDSKHWLDADTAIENAKRLGMGVGFVFTKFDPFFFVDIDHCLIGEKWSALALDMMARLPDAAVEISNSREGLHIFGTGTPPEHACKNTSIGAELYHEGRFVALTGFNIIGNAATALTSQITELVNTYFPPKTHGDDLEWSNVPCDDWSGPTNDEQLLAKALKAKSAGNVFGGSCSFADLWNGNTDAIAAAYPTTTDSELGYDGSSADAAMAQHLAFWTGNHHERILNLMKQSKLVRDKWKRDDYLKRTIRGAVTRGGGVYSLEKLSDVVEVEQPMKSFEPTVKSGYQFLAATQQIELFEGCVYIQDIHVVLTPDGATLKSDQFNATYGGYVFMKDENGKTTTKAWEAFTQSQVVNFPKVSTGCFRPKEKEHIIVDAAGRTMVNTYVEVKTPRKKGDVTRFLDHVAKLLPIERDRNIVISYMAACIQHKGTKFQWAPLIQGAPGNGKTLLTSCVAFAIGECYTHSAKSDELGATHNAWLFGKLFIGIEDVYVPEHKSEVIEVLKPMITNPRLARRGMGQDQVMGDNVANFLLNSNHKDAIRKTRSDRRFCVFFTPQQTEEDIVRDGMGGNYFPRLYTWLNDEGGFAMVADYLESYEIPEDLDPSGACHRAPLTSSTEEAIEASLGSVEQTILEAIELGKPGFRGGWISSIQLDRLLKTEGMHKRMPHNRRRAMLKMLGYDRHPGLTDGRAGSFITEEEGKPVLYVRHNHESISFTGSAALAAYKLTNY